MVIQTDHAVQAVTRHHADDLPDVLQYRGGGGTAFRPTFEHLEDLSITPAVVIYLTDLESSEFGDEPNTDVLWIKYGSYGVAPPFGEVIQV